MRVRVRDRPRDETPGSKVFLPRRDQHYLQKSRKNILARRSLLHRQPQQEQGRSNFYLESLDLCELSRGHEQ